MCLQIIYIHYIYKEDLALNNLQRLICHETKPNIYRYIYTHTHTYIYISSYAGSTDSLVSVSISAGSLEDIQYPHKADEYRS